MNALFRRTPKEMVDSISIHQEDDSPLYSKPFRLALLISLSFVFIWNSVLFIFCSPDRIPVSYTAGIPWTDTGLYSPLVQGSRWDVLATLAPSHSPTLHTTGIISPDKSRANRGVMSCRPHHMRQLYDLCVAPSKTWKPLPGGDHNSSVLEEGYFESIMDFVASVAGGADDFDEKKEGKDRL